MNSEKDNMRELSLEDLECVTGGNDYSGVPVMEPWNIPSNNPVNQEINVSSNGNKGIEFNDDCRLV